MRKKTENPKRKPTTPKSDAWREKARVAVLEHLEAGASSFAAAAKAAGIAPRTLYNWRSEDEAFDRACVHAYFAGEDAMVAEVVKRAVKGVRKPVFHAGKRVAFVVERSDTLLMFALNRRERERQRLEGRYGMSAAPPTPGLVSLDLDEMPAELRAALRLEAERQMRAKLQKEAATSPAP